MCRVVGRVDGRVDDYLGGRFGRFIGIDHAFVPPDDFGIAGVGYLLRVADRYRSVADGVDVDPVDALARGREVRRRLVVARVRRLVVVGFGTVIGGIVAQTTRSTGRSGGERREEELAASDHTDKLSDRQLAFLMPKDTK